MTILATVAVPHPPLIFPEVGQGKEKTIQKTIDAYRQVMHFVADFKPDTVVLTTPHSELYGDYFHMSGGKGADGDFARFGAPQVKIHADYDTEFVKALEKACMDQKLPCGTLGERDPALDHGSIIPLRFLNEVWTDYKVVRIGLSGLSLLKHYQLGQIIRDVSEKLGRRTIFIASGDLSHRLTVDGPYGFDAAGPLFDEKITTALDKGDFAALFAMKPDFCEAAGECGHRSFIIMAGALDGKTVKSKLLAYEGPFGVGYGVAQFEIGTNDNNRHFGEQYAAQLHQEAQQRRLKEDDFVQWARKCVETFVQTGKPIDFNANRPEKLLNEHAGVFVTLKKNGVLRGCIGTTQPVYENIASEIWHNAISACSKDPRFTPVLPDELDEITYSVDVLTPIKPVTPDVVLNPKIYGVVVQNGNRRGLLLPDIEGVDTLSQQLQIARQKAGIGPFEPVQMFYFEVERHH